MASIHTLSNGLTVIVEPIAHLESAAYELLLPGGIVSDGEDEKGACLVLAELTSRGAGTLDSRALSEAFESLGARHSESAGQERFAYRGACLAENFGEALGLTALMVREPTLPEQHIESIQSLLLQDLASLVDHPAQRAALELNSRYYPAPYNRSGLGSEQGIKAVSRASLEQMWRKQFLPRGSVLSVAGKVNVDQVLEAAQRHFGTWQGNAPERPAFGALPAYGHYHIDFESAQLQLYLAYKSEVFGGKYYYDAKVATGVLSGGMFGRLFIEVREKRGLCYSVYARHSASADYGTVSVYAGTTPERAHETLSVALRELNGLSGTIGEDELKRAKANILAALIIAEESSSSRASSNASDWWIARKVRTLEEIQAAIEAVSIASVEQYLRAFPIKEFATLTLGSRKLDVDAALRQ